MPASRHHIRVRDRRSGATSDHRFTSPTIRIGRDPASDLQLADPFVSHQHAILETHERGAVLRDLGGANGLRIAGRRLAPHAAVPLEEGTRLSVSLGPFDLEISHTADRDRRATSGALDEPGHTPLAAVHTQLRRLHALHAPHVAARRAFESALAEAIHAADDPSIARRILAEFPPSDHAHLLLSHRTAPSPTDLPGGTPASQQSPHLSLTPSPASHSPHLSLAPSPASHSPHLSLAPPLSSQSPHLSLKPSLDITAARDPPPLTPSPASPSDPRPPDSATTILSAPLPPGPAVPRALARLATAAHALLPSHRPPTSLDEADRFLDRLVATTRTLAAGLGALQHLRLRQARDLGVTPVDRANPLLTLTDADDLLAALLDWRGADTDRTSELLDCFTVLAAHARAHVDATLAATRHLAAELAPPTIDQHAARRLLRSRARWHSFLDRYAAILGDDTAPGTLRTSFRAAYLAELEHHGLAVTPTNTTS